MNPARTSEPDARSHAASGSGDALDARIVEAIAADAAGVDPIDPAVATGRPLRERPRGRTLAYELAGGARLVAKHYAAPAEAVMAHRILVRLGATAFGPASRHQVPEPVGLSSRWGVLLMAMAAGESLEAATAGVVSGDRDVAAWEAAIRDAGSWLARLHAQRPSLGPREGPAHAAIAVARRAARASARHPHHEALLLDLLTELDERGRAADAGRIVQVHGRFHASHVFVAPGRLTVVDLDRAAIADAAVDVGEFLHRLSLLSRALAPNERARGRLAFLQGYRADGAWIGPSLLFHWSCSLLCTLLHAMDRGHPRLERRIERYRAQFAAIPAHVEELWDAR